MSFHIPKNSRKLNLVTEGVRKFGTKAQLTSSLNLPGLAELSVWREILFSLELIGRHPERYGGYAYGNVSRLAAPFNRPATKKRFIISGSQTSGMQKLGRSGYTLVTRCDPFAEQHGRVEWRGPVEASSESMTHAAVYDAYPRARFVFHVHSHEIWSQAERLKIPVTDKQFEYGTPEIAGDVKRLFGKTRLRSIGVFAMGGHEDGIVSFGATAAETGLRLISFLAKARTNRP